MIDEKHVLSQVQTLFNGKVKYLHLGCPNDFHPKSNGFKDRMNQVLAILGHHENTLIAPRVQFTNIIATQQPGAFVFEEDNGLWRTSAGADGVLIHNTAPVAIFNADCHVGILYHHKTHRFALIHLGLKCFYREDGSPNIITQAITSLDVSARELEFWAGAGIGPCCNGYDHSDPKNAELGKKLNQKFGYEDLPVVGYRYKDKYCHITGFVTNGPRIGQISYDNGSMISRIGINHPGMMVELDPGCTSCQGREQFPDRPQFWSNVRGHKERNLFLCWLA
ncbi:MAG: laccase domain-containing protein [Patescibacteria group bacterium]|nr:laccase domain-containing protein [Patescibacteria group bacterium]